MPLTKGTTAITILEVEDPKSLKLSQQSLAACSLPSFHTGEEKVMGLVPLDDPFDVDWKSSPSYGEYMAFGLRIDSKKIPGAVLKKHFDKALREEEAKGEKVSKSRKKEIKERIKDRLLSKAEAVPAVHEVAVNTQTGRVFVATTSNAVIKHVLEYMSRFSSGVKELCPAEDQETREVITNFLQKIVIDGIKSRNAEIYACGKVTVADADMVFSAQSKSDVEIKEIRKAINDGKSVVSTGVKINTGDGLETTGAIGVNFRISGLKLPPVDKQGEGEAEFEALLLERMYLIDKAVGILVDALRA